MNSGHTQTERKASVLCEFKTLNRRRGLFSLPPGFPWPLCPLGDFIRLCLYLRLFTHVPCSLPPGTLPARSVRIPSPLTSFTPDESLAALDTTFWDGLDVSGWVPVSQRGYVNGKASNVPSSHSNNTVLAWSNSDAQYWYAPCGTGINRRSVHRYSPTGPAPAATGLSLHRP